MENSADEPHVEGEEVTAAERPEEILELEDALSRARMGMTILLILFLLALGLLVYYQFYQGNGHWAFELRHKDAATAQVNTAPQPQPEMAALQHRNDSLLTLVNNAAAAKTTGATNGFDTTATYYTVQIAAFKGEDISAFQNALPAGEMRTEGSISRLMLGHFDTQAQAQTFQKTLSRKGIQGLVKKMD